MPPPQITIVRLKQMKFITIYTNTNAHLNPFANICCKVFFYYQYLCYIIFTFITNEWITNAYGLRQTAFIYFYWHCATNFWQKITRKLLQNKKMRHNIIYYMWILGPNWCIDLFDLLKIDSKILISLNIFISLTDYNINHINLQNY